MQYNYNGFVVPTTWPPRLSSVFDFFSHQNLNAISVNDYPGHLGRLQIFWSVSVRENVTVTDVNFNSYPQNRNAFIFPMRCGKSMNTGKT